MGSSILRGITTALLVTVLTLLAGTALSVMKLGGQTLSDFLDIGLLVSCLVGGYRTAKESGKWWLGGIVGVGYVTVGTALLALFLPIRGWGFVQVLAEGAIIGLVAGAVGTGGSKPLLWSGKSPRFTPSEAVYETNGLSSRFNWDKEGKSNEWQEAPMINWNESGEKSTDVEWPWDKERGKTTISSDTGDAEPLVIGEPDPVRPYLWERDRSSLSDKKTAKGSKPWWEE